MVWASNITNTVGIANWRCKNLYIYRIEKDEYKHKYRIHFIYITRNNVLGFVEYKYKRKKLTKSKQQYGEM
jgi:hypothetical protein